MEILARLGDAGFSVIPYPMLTEDQRYEENENPFKYSNGMGAAYSKIWESVPFAYS